MFKNINIKFFVFSAVFPIRTLPLRDPRPAGHGESPHRPLVEALLVFISIKDRGTGTFF